MCSDLGGWHSQIVLEPGDSTRRYDLGRLHGHRDHPSRFRDDEIVEIRPGDRFVSIRQRADVA